MAISAFATWPVPVRSPSCSTTGFACRKSSAQSAKSGNGFLTAGLAGVRLHAGALSDVQVEQSGGRTDKYGQFVLAVDHARDDPDELFDRAHAAEQIGDIAEAERLYRILMKSDPTDASAPFNLGNMLRAAGRTVEAEAALRAATRANPAFAEAWYNLADLLDDQGRSEAAIDCLRKALVVAPDYIDAMFNLALLLQRKGALTEAADYWRRYLASDRSSEWAVRARRSLKFCEIQVNSLACSAGLMRIRTRRPNNSARAHTKLRRRTVRPDAVTAPRDWRPNAFPR